jgi:hypothetical protein
MSLLDHKQPCSFKEEERKWRSAATSMLYFLGKSVSKKDVKRLLANVALGADLKVEETYVRDAVSEVQTYVFSAFGTWVVWLYCKDYSNSNSISVLMT